MSRGQSWYALLTVVLALVLVTLLGITLVSLNRKATLTVASGQKGGTYLPIAEVIGDLVAQGSRKVRLVVESSDGSVDNMRRLIDRRADIALVQNDTVAGDSVRTLVPLHTGALHFLVRTDSEIRSVADLEGHKIGIGLETSGTHRMVTALFNHYELDFSKVERVELPIEDACQQLKDGKIEALLIVLSLRSHSLVDLVSAGEIKLVGIGRDLEEGSVLQGFRLAYPFIEPVMIPRYSYGAPHGSLPGVPPEPVPTIGVQTVLVAHRDVPEDLAREITRVVIEKRSILTREFEGVNMTEDDLDPRGLQFPLHRGAMAYYNRHEPAFLERYAEVIGLLITLAITAWGLIATGRRWLGQRKKERIDEYYTEVNQILGRLEEAGTSEEFDEIEASLYDVRSTALQLLTSERLIADESFRIFQSLLAEAVDEVRYRREQAGKT